jgi:putative endonuclease
MDLMKIKAGQKHEEWLVYILLCSDGSFYTGATNCLEKRIVCHNRGKASRYTRSRRPVSVLAASDTMGKSEALQLEIKIKKLPKSRKIDCLKKSRTENDD